jgi:Dimerisation domain
MSTELISDTIMQLGMGFWSSKALLSAIELGLFTELAKGPQDSESLRTRLELHPRGARDFFDALVSLGMLERQNGRYANTSESDLFLDRAKSSYMGAFWKCATHASMDSGAT